MKEGLITLSQEQLKILKVINSFIDKSITRQEATELISISPRQITRLNKEAITSGAECIFRSPKTGKLTVEELIDGKTVNLTQFGRTMHELGVDMMFAQVIEIVRINYHSIYH